MTRDITGELVDKLVHNYVKLEWIQNNVTEWTEIQNEQKFISFTRNTARKYKCIYRWCIPLVMNELMKSYIAHVSSRRLFRTLNIESNLARPVIIQIQTQSPGRYTAELPLRRIKLFFILSKFALCAKYSHIVDFLGSRRMETAPTSIEVRLRPTPGQSDDLSDLLGSLSPTIVYMAPGRTRRSPIQLWTGPGVA